MVLSYDTDAVDDGSVYNVISLQSTYLSQIISDLGTSSRALEF